MENDDDDGYNHHMVITIIIDDDDDLVRIFLNLTLQIGHLERLG